MLSFTLPTTSKKKKTHEDQEEEEEEEIVPPLSTHALFEVVSCEIHLG